ncbi:hypothetical protein [Maribellus maritimus]|uniref:hypothetical protein n=1 Tax=Maribellus maritimus TaxID=2870838 RepID=UPI001EEAB6FD|nr:hypothetical protein [Maribellus maritimus]MCG6191463.1 hypothetical protein [Maribellus maritimus]
MREKIWYEMMQIKFGEKYLAFYLSLQYRFKKIFKILTLVFSGSGILGWKLWQPIAWIALVLIASIQILSLIENQIIRSDKEIGDIAKLRELYLKYFNKLEKLWVDLDTSKITEDEASQLFFRFRSKDFQIIEKLDNTLGIKKWKKIEKKADLEARQYFNTYHS